MFTGKTPDVTPAQILAALTWIGAQAVAYGWITNQTDQLTLSVTATALAAGWKIADAIIRYGRSRHANAQPPQPTRGDAAPSDGEAAAAVTTPAARPAVGVTLPG